MENDTFQSIEEATSGILYKVKSSKFYGFAFPVQTEEACKDGLEQVKKLHPSARHWCYAWQLGIGNEAHYRVNDDGEPSNTAGKPIYGQLLSYEVTNILLVVVRYFGGTKLGVGGLIQAYKTTAQLTLDSASIEQKVQTSDCTIRCSYALLSKVLRVAKTQQVTIVTQTMEQDCTITFAIRNRDLTKIKTIFENIYGVTILSEDQPNAAM